MSFITRILTPKPELSKERQLFDGRALKAMIIPLVIEQMLQMIVGIADTLMVSYAGEATVSGVSLDTMIYMIFIYLFTAVASGGAVVVSQYLGSRNRENADHAASQIYMIAGLASGICTVVMLLAGPAFLGLLYPKVDPAVMDACRTYLRIVTISFPANAIYNAGAALFRSMGRTKTTMMVSSMMNLINVAGNAIGIFVLRAGAAGVAWPTTISWYFAAVVMTFLCMNKNNAVSLRIKSVFHIDKRMAARILGIAIPNAIENVLFQAAKVVLGSLVSTFGTSQIAANGIAQTLWALSSLMSVSMGPVYITVVGQCIGAGDTEAADWYMHRLTRLSILLCIVWNAIFLLAVPFILPLYSITAETRRLVWIAVLIHSIFTCAFHTMAFPLSAGLRAAGDVKFTMFAALFATVVCRTAMSFIFGLGMNMGVIGITLAMVFDWVIKAALDLHRWRGGKWKRFKII